jgi:nitroreductase
MPSPVAFDDFARLVHDRRTSMFVDQTRPVPVAIVEELCELVTWAPNHKKTWPWRFAFFTDNGRARLGDTMVADMIDAEFGDEGKRLKTRTKYLRTPAVLVVGATVHDNSMLDLENRDSVAAGIQNLLLGATSIGLASFWSTPALTSPPRVLELCGFDATDRIVAMIYLGWANEPAPAPERPTVEIKRISD